MGRLLFVFVYKGKNFYRGGKREREAAEGGIVLEPGSREA